MRIPLPYLCALVLAACTTTPTTTDPGQLALNATADTCSKVVAAIKAVDASINAKVLKGNDARRALDGLALAQTGCVSTLAVLTAASVPASGATK